MKRRLLRILAALADFGRDSSDRVHGWAIRKLTEDNFRQLTMDFPHKKGWFR